MSENIINEREINNNLDNNNNNERRRSQRGEEFSLKINKLKEIFPNENDEKLFNILKQSNWEIEIAVLNLLDHSNIENSSSSISTPATTITTTILTENSSSIPSEPTISKIPSTRTPRTTSQSSSNLIGLSSTSSISISTTPPPPYHSASFPNLLHDSNDQTNILPKSKFKGAKRGTQKLLPDDFLEIPLIKTVIVPSSTQNLEQNDYLEYKVYYNRKDRGLDMNVKIVEKSVYVSGLTSNIEGQLGLSELAGVSVGDILYGINDEYFPMDISLQEVTTVIARSGQYVCLHFIRFQKNSSSIVCNGQVRRAGQLRKIHPCALSLIDQNLVSVDDIEVFCEDLIRLKQRLFSWSSGTVVSREKISDLSSVLIDEINDGNDGNKNYSYQNNNYSRDDLDDNIKYDKSKKKRLSVDYPTNNINYSIINPFSNTSTDSTVIEITKNWYRDIQLTTVNIQPAVCMRIIDHKFMNDHVEYIMWVEDISTGLEWYTRRRYKEFFKLREKLISIWNRFALIPFPSRTTLSVVGSNTDIVNERRPILENFIRTVYQIIVTEPLKHLFTNQIYFLIYNFLDVNYNLKLIEFVLLKQSNSYGEYMNTILRDTQDITIEPSMLIDNQKVNQFDDPLIYIRRIIEIYIHSILQLKLFANKLINKFVKKFINQCSNDTIRWTTELVDEKLRDISEFINSLQEVLFNGLKEDIYEIIEYLIHGNIIGRYSQINNNNNNNNNVDNSDNDNNDNIDNQENNNKPFYLLRNDIIDNLFKIGLRRQLEKEIYIPCSSLLTYIIRQTFTKEDYKLIAKLSRLTQQPQSFYGIPLQYISPSSWDEVVSSLRKLLHQITIPYDKLQILVTSGKLITISYYDEHTEPSSSSSSTTSTSTTLNTTSMKPKSLGADDVLPIFIYCLIMSKLEEKLLIISKELEFLIDDEYKVSEIGYYLATLQASIYHISDINENIGDKFVE